ncbi:MAG: hypothetical protein AAGI51_17190 [Pseudomonadota bacterium]
MAPERMLSAALWVCVAYFLAMAAAHGTGLKVPILFVYYDTPYFAYQDLIISFCVVVYAIFFAAAARHREIAPYAVAALWVTTLGLARVNLSPALAEAAAQGASTYWAYWVQTGLVGAIAAAVTVLWRRAA